MLKILTWLVNVVLANKDIDSCICTEGSCYSWTSKSLDPTIFKYCLNVQY
uniref:Uncharacterized protein n=1 Tax=Arundo donax TaxID=35708 RepID=A0A0A9GS48_ARUDO